MIYLDNAATSYPKPFEIRSALLEGISIYGANPGRSGHDMSLAAAGKVYDTREKFNTLFGGYGAENVVFTYNCTYALNTAIKGVVKKGDHVLISSLEHNSVVRPLSRLKADGLCAFNIVLSIGSDDEIVAAFEAAITPQTSVIVCTHASNVFGRVMPIEKIGALAKRRGLAFIVDAAQTAGVFPINMKAMNINCLCMPGHKGLYGLQGTGVLMTDGICVLASLVEGGTGSRSFDIVQPPDMPEMLESGTLNVPGICSLNAGISFIEGYGQEKLYDYEFSLTRQAFLELSEIKNIRLYTTKYEKGLFAPILSFNIEGLHSEQAAAALNKRGVAVRAGYHCAPLAHKTYGTEDSGTIRLSPSVHTEKKDLKTALNYIYQIAKSV